jgi:excisionase family DNA binding protein
MTTENTASARILIPLPGIGTLSLDSETYRAGLADGAARTGTNTPTPGDNYGEPLYDSEQLALLLNIPVSWLERSALEGRIPSLQFGRWRRFRRSEVEAAVRGKWPG